MAHVPFGKAVKCPGWSHCPCGSLQSKPPSPHANSPDWQLVKQQSPLSNAQPSLLKSPSQ
eukprot:scaffold4425_cov204-Pinguiococcus_pyrenoidosus.AAC.1